MIKVQCFKNQLMSSICYIVYDDSSNRCLVIDPGSEKSFNEIDFITHKNLCLDYIILTHEHTDHTWGVNALLEKYPEVKVICSVLCKEALSKEARNYFQYYYDNSEYSYCVARVDLTTEALGGKLQWNGKYIFFYNTPGHSKGSICVEIEGLLFGGDTLMPCKPFIKKKLGGSLTDYRNSLLFLLNKFDAETIVYPGHGDVIKFNKILPYYSRILEMVTSDK